MCQTPFRSYTSYWCQFPDWTPRQRTQQFRERSLLRVLLGETLPGYGVKKSILIFLGVCHLLIPLPYWFLSMSKTPCPKIRSKLRLLIYSKNIIWIKIYFIQDFGVNLVRFLPKSASNHYPWYLFRSGCKAHEVCLWGWAGRIGQQQMEGRRIHDWLSIERSMGDIFWDRKSVV